MSDGTWPDSDEPRADPPQAASSMPASPGWGSAPGPGGTWLPPGAAPTGAGGSWLPPPVPSAKRNRAHLVWLAITVACVIASGSAGFAIGKDSSQIKSAIKNASAAAGAGPCLGTTPAPDAGSQLVSEMLQLPAGATRPKVASTPHVLSLGQYMTTLYSGSSFERAILIAHCFEVAATETWVEPSGEIVSVYLAQFGDAADARSYILATQTADMSDPGNKIHFSLDGVSDGLLVANPSLDKYGNTLSRLLGDRANVSIIIHVYTPARLPSQAVVDTILRRQSARI